MLKTYLIEYENVISGSLQNIHTIIHCRSLSIATDWAKESIKEYGFSEHFTIHRIARSKKGHLYLTDRIKIDL